jgi:ketosteroid isomerase-like protein
MALRPMKQVIFPAHRREIEKYSRHFLKKVIMNLKKVSLFIPTCFSVFLLFFSCNIETKTVKKSLSADEIVNADIAFSDMSRQLGMKKAFLEYIDNDGVLLRPDHPPIIGAEAIDFLSSINDTSYTLTWKPSRGEIAASGDFGFTFGIYELKTKDTAFKGTYVSIWKKQNDGAWKFVLDSGNQGIEPAQ